MYTYWVSHDKLHLWAVHCTLLWPYKRHDSIRKIESSTNWNQWCCSVISYKGSPHLDRTSLGSIQVNHTEMIPIIWNMYLFNGIAGGHTWHNTSCRRRTLDCWTRESINGQMQILGNTPYLCSFLFHTGVALFLIFYFLVLHSGNSIHPFFSYTHVPDQRRYFWGTRGLVTMGLPRRELIRMSIILELELQL